MHDARVAPVRRAIYAILPLILFFVLYWPGLTIYFYQDDFGWLNLRHEVAAWRDIPAALFVPKAHGNLRPWSETGFFLLFSTLFGANALPFRICVFATACADLLLLGAVVRRLTASDTAALWTELLWMANSCVAVAACWTSIYNQFQYVFFILAAFYLWLRGRYVWQWIVFLLGLGSLEVVVMYPALVSLYALLFARPRLKKALAMFIASGVYGVLHFAIARPVSEGPYALHFDARMFQTLWSYWTLALGPERLAHFNMLSAEAAAAATALLTAGVAIFMVARLRRGDRLPVFALGWFVILLAPLVPLRDHISDYYLTGPAIGLALLGAWAIRCYRGGYRGAGMAAAAVYLAVSIPAAWATVRWHHARAAAVEDLVLGVEQVRQLHPGKTVLLTGVGSDLFYAGIDAVPFLALEMPSVYLAPGAEANILAPPDRVSLFQLPEGMARAALDEERAVVYDVSGEVFRNVTRVYRRMWQPGPPAMVNCGDAAFAAYLTGDWQPVRNGSRRMGRRAAVRIAAPKKAGEQLHVGVLCDRAPLRLRIAAGGRQAEKTLARCDLIHTFAMPLMPGTAVEMEVVLEADPAGAARFGYLAVR